MKDTNFNPAFGKYRETDIHPDVLYHYAQNKITFAYNFNTRKMKLEDGESDHYKLMGIKFRDPSEHQKLQKENILGRIGDYDGKHYLSIWNRNISLSLLKELFYFLLKNKLVSSDTLIWTPNNRIPKTIKEIEHNEHKISDEELELYKKLHLLRGQEKVNAMKKLGVGLGGKEHPVASAMKKHKLLKPGQKWWAPYSESEYISPDDLFSGLDEDHICFIYTNDYHLYYETGVMHTELISRSPKLLAKYHKVDPSYGDLHNYQRALKYYTQFSLNIDLYGRISNSKKIVSFWNEKKSLYQKYLKDCIKELYNKKLIDQSYSVHTPFEVLKATDILGNIQITKELSEKQKEELELYKKLHLLRGQEKVDAMKKLGVGLGGKEHPIAIAMKKHNLLKPGQKWWAPHSESSFYNFLEINQEYLSKIKKKIKSFAPEKSDFKDIFGNKSRIVIPLENKIANEFIDNLEKLGLTDIDIKKGTGKFKEREVQISKFLSRLNKNQMLDWYSKNKVALTKESEFSIIISINPIDIIRMSDHKGISSCHAPGRDWFHCSIQEAKTGGAMAYLVKTEDLNKIKNLNDKEIFQDNDRGIQGIEPLSRIKIRRFDDEQNSYLVPMKKEYGLKNDDFFQTLKTYLLEKQKDKIKDIDFKKITLRGGSYSDEGHYPNDMWSYFLDRKITSIPTASKDRSNKEANLMQNILDRAHAELEHSFLYAEYDGNYLSFTSSIEIEIDKNLINENKFKNNQDDVEKDINKVINLRIGDIVIQEKNLEIVVNTDQYNPTVEGLENLLDDLIIFDQNYDEYKRKIENILIVYDIMKFDVPGLENFDWSMDTDNSGDLIFKFNSESFEIGNLEGTSSEILKTYKYHINVYGITYSPYLLLSDLKEYLSKAFKVYHQYNLEFDIDLLSKFQTNREITAGSLHEKNPIMFSINSSLENPTEEQLKKLVLLDKNFDNIVNFAKKWWNKEKHTYMPKYSSVKDYTNDLTKQAIKEMENQIKSKIIHSDIDNKNDFEFDIIVKKVGQNLQYYVKFKKFNFELPFFQMKERLENDLRKAFNIRLDLRYPKSNNKILQSFPSAVIILKYINGNTVYLYKEKSDSSTEVEVPKEYIVEYFINAKQTKDSTIQSLLK